MSDASTHQPYKVHYADVSYFSGKLETYLRYNEIPHQLVEMTARSGVTDIYANTGVRKVPAVETADGLWLKETTNMIDWFETQHADTIADQSIIPTDPSLAFLCKLVEDYADEWCWRSAMYWRWRSDDNAQLLGSRIGHEVFKDWVIPASWSGKLFKARQRMNFLKGDGLNAETEEIIAGHYHRLSESLTELLTDQKFLLGNKPTLVDIAFMGPFYRHYFCDPIPAKIMRDKYPAVLEWVARMWNTNASQLSFGTEFSDFSHPGWQFILKEIMQDYLPYLHANKAAWLAGQKRFDCTTTQATFKHVPVVHHRVYCLERLEEQYQTLDTDSRANVDAILSQYGDISLSGKTTSGIKNSYELPLKPRPKMTKLEYWEAYLFGSPWDMNRRPK